MFLDIFYLHTSIHIILLKTYFYAWLHSACQSVASEIRTKIEEFRPSIPLIRGLRNPGMRNRHWELLSERININLVSNANLTFSCCLEMGLQKHVEEISQVAQEAGKEYAIEQVSVIFVSWSCFSGAFYLFEAHKNTLSIYTKYLKDKFIDCKPD